MPGFPDCAFIRRQLGARVHFWPSDDWDIPAGLDPSRWEDGRSGIRRLQCADVQFTLNSMAKTSKPALADPTRKQAVIYARVSSKEQEKEGFSIPAQLKLLKEYAAANGLAVAQEYVDVETAKQAGRAAFGEMVAISRRIRPSA
jgi:hypothetical protein